MPSAPKCAASASGTRAPTTTSTASTVPVLGPAARARVSDAGSALVVVAIAERRGSVATTVLDRRDAPGQHQHEHDEREPDQERACRRQHPTIVAGRLG